MAAAIAFRSRSDRREEAVPSGSKKPLGDGVVSGYGTVDGRLVAEGLDAGHVLYWDAQEGLGALVRAWLGR